MKDKSILKKIGKYSLAAGATVLSGNLANAEAPVGATTAPFDLTPGVYGIDFDGNDIPEILVSVLSGYSTYAISWSPDEGLAAALLRPGPDLSYNESYFAVIKGGPYFNSSCASGAAALTLNQPIGTSSQLQNTSSHWSASVWRSIIWSNTDYGTSCGIYDDNFHNYPNQARMVGVSYTKNGTDWYYGWIKFTASAGPYYVGEGNANLGTINSFSVSTTPNTTILAGQPPADPVPMSPWATAMGLGLIGLFGFYKTRKKANA